MFSQMRKLFKSWPISVRQGGKNEIGSVVIQKRNWQCCYSFRFVLNDSTAVINFQMSQRSHPRHLMGKRTAQKDTIIDITSDSQMNSNFTYRWSPASLTFNNYYYLFDIYL